jgi:hypothetical protein
MSKIEYAMDLIRADTLKMAVLKSKNLSVGDIRSLLAYYNLSHRDWLILLNFKGDDYMTYCEMRELEYFCNRDGGEGMTYADGRAVLTKDEYDAQIVKSDPYIVNMSYRIYLEMRRCDEEWCSVL